MIDLVRKAIEALKFKVNSNLTEIKINETKFRSLLAEKDTKKNQDELDKILEKNKNLLSENFDFINVQVTLFKFLEKYKYHEILKDSQLIENKDINDEGVTRYFERTINGMLPYTAEHPLYNDNSFFRKLIQYYEDREEYEKCAELLNSKNTSSLL
jgi:hypothetical protein